MQQNHEKPNQADEPMPDSTPDPSTEPTAVLPAPRRNTLGQWWAQGFRTAFLRTPRWPAASVGAGQIVLLLLVPLLLSLLAERLMFTGPATFYWPSLLTQGWMEVVASMFACWWVMQPDSGAPARRVGGPAIGAGLPVAPEPEAPVPGFNVHGSTAPGAVSLFAMLCAQSLPLTVLTAWVMVPIARKGDGMPLQLSAFALCWAVAVQLRLLWCCGIAPRAQRATAMTVLALAAVTSQQFAGGSHWYPTPDLEAYAQQPFQLTQQLVERQSQLMQQQLQALHRHQPGRAELYTITYAPNAEEAVFRREGAMVTEVMQQRFGTRGRSIQLASQQTDVPDAGWATPLNLQRAIERFAQLMDREQDVLFIHLTSHGARNGELAHSFRPLHVEGLHPQQLKAWLDAAGIRHRIISVSACFSGSWIGPLAGDNTLVMTAADSEHTSYGCGRKSELTFFGRAMYDEALRDGADFETAFAQAREVIARREKEAGKSDGYSNPQMAMGAGLRDQLRLLQAGPGTPASAGRRLPAESGLAPPAGPGSEPGPGNQAVVNKGTG